MAPTDRETSILRQLFNVANSLKDTCQFPSTVPSRPVAVPPSVVVLPDAPSIQSKLLRLGLDPLVAKSISKKYDLRSQELRSRAQTTLHRTCVDLALVRRPAEALPLPQLLETVVSIHTARYLKALGALEEHAVTFASKLPCSEQPRRTSKRAERKPLKPFNREFIPFLEKYFEYNAFPSSADRAEMAKKSMMEPRQIEVWFQNHRRRAKEEGRNVRKLGPTDPAPLELCLKSMEEKMEPYLIPDGLRQSVDSEVSEAGSDDEEDDDEFYNEKPAVVDLTDVLNPPAARHAYPVKFKDSRKFASTILSTQEFSFPPPNWPRKAAVALPKRPVETMDDLLLSFAGLHIYDGRQVLSPPFQISTTVIPPTAPLPALVRAKSTPSRVLTTTSLNTVRAPSARRHPFRSPSPYAQPATLVPADASATTSPRRKKVAGPPRRTPTKKRAPNTSHRGASPANSDTSTLRSVSPPSRTPSLESTGFSPSRTPSFGSSAGGFSSRSSSSSSSGPTTPSGSPATLPLEIVDLDRFGDFARIQQYGYATSPVEEPEYPQHVKRQRRRQVGFEQYASQR